LLAQGDYWMNLSFIMVQKTWTIRENQRVKQHLINGLICKHLKCIMSHSTINVVLLHCFLMFSLWCSSLLH
jgi:hypothetical protein